MNKNEILTFAKEKYTDYANEIKTLHEKINLSCTDELKDKQVLDNIKNLIEERKQDYQFLLKEILGDEKINLSRSFTSFGAILCTKNELEAISTKYPLTYSFFQSPGNSINKDNCRVISLRGHNYYFFYRELKDKIDAHSSEMYLKIINNLDIIENILVQEYQGIDINNMPFAEKKFLLALLDQRKNILLSLLNSTSLLQLNNFEILAGDNNNITKNAHHFEKGKKYWESKEIQDVINTIPAKAVNDLINLIQIAVDDYYGILTKEKTEISLLNNPIYQQMGSKIANILNVIHDTVGKFNKKYEKNMLKKIVRSDRSSDHPLLILLQSFLQNQRDENKNIKQDFIVPLLYGGLELAFVYKTINKLIKANTETPETNSSILPVVFSQYNVKNFSTTGVLNQYLKDVDLDSLQNKNILLLDDNIVSGKTFDGALKMLIEQGATVSSSVTEIDMDKIEKNYLPASLMKLIYPSVAQILPINEQHRVNNPGSMAITYNQMLNKMLKNR